MASNFKYAGISDLQKYFNRIDDFDNKRQIFNWVEATELPDWQGVSGQKIYYATNTGLISQLYRNGEEMYSIPTSNLTTETTQINVGTALADAMNVDSTSDLSDHDILKIGNEYIGVTDITDSNVLTCVSDRHLFGTMSVAHAVDTSVYTAIDANVLGNENDWFLYDEELDLCIIGLYNTDANEQIYEAGTDYKTFMEQALVDASLELHNYIDARYTTPLQKIKQVDIDTAALSIAEEYDPIIIKSVCYMASANLIRAKEGVSEEADYFHSLVTNPERTGLIDKLNDGIYKLSSEVDANDKKGSIRHRAVSGTMDIVEIAGTYTGELYDLLQVEIESTGAYGVSSYKTHYYGNNKLYGSTSGTDTITGGLQALEGGSGLYVRFQGASATDGDIWEIEVAGSHRKQTNKSNATIEMVR